MPPAERAKRLSRTLQTYFRIDLFSALVERDFERRLADVILAAERDAFQRGQEAALGPDRLGRDKRDRPPAPAPAPGPDSGSPIPPLATPDVGEVNSRTA